MSRLTEILNSAFDGINAGVFGSNPSLDRQADANVFSGDGNIIGFQNPSGTVLGSLVGLSKSPPGSTSASSRNASTPQQVQYFDAPYAEMYGMSAQTAYQEALANTAHQREVADLKAAGLNPVLGISGSGSGGVSGATVQSTGSVNSGKSGSDLSQKMPYIGTIAGTLVGIAYGKASTGASTGLAVGKALEALMS